MVYDNRNIRIDADGTVHVPDLMGRSVLVSLSGVPASGGCDIKDQVVHGLSGAYEWLKGRRDKDTSGPDRITRKSVESAGLVDDLIEDLRQSVLNGTYRAQPALAWKKRISKNKVRELATVNLRDALFQRAFRWPIEALAERQFTPFSFGYRNGRGPQLMIDVAVRFISLSVNTVYIVKMDVKDCFGTLDRGLLRRFFAEICDDRWAWAMVQQVLDAGLVDSLRRRLRPSLGIYQGVPISPLLANIYLNPLDAAMAARIDHRTTLFLRYGDDMFIIHHGTRSEAKALSMVLHALLRERLRLRPAPNKYSIRSDRVGFEMLGQRIRRRTRSGVIEVQPTKKKIAELEWAVTTRIQRAERDVRRITGRKASVSDVIEAVNETVDGWSKSYQFTTEQSALKSAERRVDRALLTWLHQRHPELNEAEIDRRYRLGNTYVSGDQRLYRCGGLELRPYPLRDHLGCRPASSDCFLNGPCATHCLHHISHSTSAQADPSAKGSGRGRDG